MFVIYFSEGIGRWAKKAPSQILNVWFEAGMLDFIFDTECCRREQLGLSLIAVFFTPHSPPQPRPKGTEGQNNRNLLAR